MSMLSDKPSDSSKQPVGIPSASLQLKGGANDGKSVDLTGSVTWVGRDATSDIVIEDARVSRQHAGIRQDRMGYWIKDMSSRNGTYVNGMRIRGEGQRLQNMDRLEFGASGEEFWLFQYDGEGSSTFDTAGK